MKSKGGGWKRWFDTEHPAKVSLCALSTWCLFLESQDTFKMKEIEVKVTPLLGLVAEGVLAVILQGLLLEPFLKFGVNGS